MFWFIFGIALGMVIGWLMCLTDKTNEEIKQLKEAGR